MDIDCNIILIVTFLIVLSSHQSVIYNQSVIYYNVEESTKFKLRSEVKRQEVFDYNNNDLNKITNFIHGQAKKTILDTKQSISLFVNFLIYEI